MKVLTTITERDSHELRKPQSRPANSQQKTARQRKRVELRDSQSGKSTGRLQRVGVPFHQRTFGWSGNAFATLTHVAAYSAFASKLDQLSNGTKPGCFAERKTALKASDKISWLSSLAQSAYASSIRFAPSITSVDLQAITKSAAHDKARVRLDTGFIYAASNIDCSVDETGSVTVLLYPG
jgi:hypothetical protein